MGLRFKSADGFIYAFEKTSTDDKFRIPSGKNLAFKLDSPYAISVDTNPIPMKLTEDQRIRYEIPVGNFSVPWLARDSEVRIVGSTYDKLDAKMTSSGEGYVSRSLPPGTYNIEITGPYTFNARVKVVGKETVELEGYRTVMIETLLTERGVLGAQVSKKSGNKVMGFISIGVAALSAYFAIDNYVKGGEEYDVYRTAVSSAAATASREAMDGYRAGLYIWSGAGGLALIGVPSFFLSGPGSLASKNRMNAIDKDLLALGYKK